MTRFNSYNYLTGEDAHWDRELQIEASEERIRAARERLAKLQNDKKIDMPENHPQGAPYVAREDGAFLAGNAQQALRDASSPTPQSTTATELETTPSSLKSQFNQEKYPDNQEGLLETPQRQAMPMDDLPPTPTPPAGEGLAAQEAEHGSKARGLDESQVPPEIEQEEKEQMQPPRQGAKLKALLERHGDFQKDPDSALLDSDFLPSITAKTSDLAEVAIEHSQGQGNKDEERNESVRADSSSFKLLGEAESDEPESSDLDIAGELLQGVESGSVPCHRATKMAGLFSKKLRKHGIEDRNLASLASTPTNSCRHLHRFVARTGKRLPVKISYVKTFVKKITKSRVQEVEVDFPTLPLSAWMEVSFSLGGHFFLGGKGVDHFQSFSQILHDWWVSYKKIDPTLPFFQDFDESHYGYSFPVAVHGDEGRGRYKRPIMIFSYQPLITNFEGHTNLKGSTYCTRLLYSAVPSSMYAKNDKTIDGLVTALVKDFCDLYYSGFDANISGHSVKLRPVYVGMKGDWPYLRKILKLRTGFQARIVRKCHFCDVPDWWNMSPEGQLRNLQRGYESPSPFKVNIRSPVFDLPGGSSPWRIQTDPAHTYHIGYGKDENASIIIVLTMIGHFGTRGSFNSKLDTAFERFAVYCKINQKHTSITEFSKKLFKINKGSGCFPCGGGKGHDTAVLGSWLETELAIVDAAAVAKDPT
eukprot:s546_g5.t2